MYKKRLSPEEKIHFIEKYKRGEGSYASIAADAGVDRRSFRQWVRNYMRLAARMYSSNDIISAILLSLRKLLSTIIFLAWIHKMLYAENTDFVRGDSYKTGL